MYASLTDGVLCMIVVELIYMAHSSLNYETWLKVLITGAQSKTLLCFALITFRRILVS